MKKAIRLIGLIIALTMIFCCSVFAESSAVEELAVDDLVNIESSNEYRPIEYLLINDNEVYSDETGNLFSLENGEYTAIEGLCWDAENLILSMDNAALKSLRYLDPEADNLFTLNLSGDNEICDFEEAGLKDSILVVQNLLITGSGNLNVILGQNTDWAVHFTMDCYNLILADSFEGNFTVNNMDMAGPAIEVGDTLAVFGGSLFTNAEIDATNIYIEAGNLTTEIETYASCGICTSLIDPALDSGTFEMYGGHVSIINNVSMVDGWYGRGLWSGAEVILDGGSLDIECNGEAITAESLLLDGTELSAISNYADVFACRYFEAAGNVIDDAVTEVNNAATANETQAIPYIGIQQFGSQEGGRLTSLPDASETDSNNYSVILYSYDEYQKVALIKYFRENLRLSLAEGKALSESVPVTICAGLSKNQALYFADELMSFGGYAEIQGSDEISTYDTSDSTESSSYDVVIQGLKSGITPNLILYLRNNLGLSLKEAKNFLESLPMTIFYGVTSTEAHAAKGELAGLGAVAVIIEK